jgi:hypothetical protein
MSNFLTILPVRFDNEPFVRSLTASMLFLSGTEYIPATGADIVRWTFDPTTVWAATLSGDTYTSGTTASVSALGTMVFYVTADTYDFTIENYTLLQTGITGAFLSGSPLSVISTSAYDIVYDTFPFVEGMTTIYINYENTNNSTIFYRLTAASPYVFNYYATSPFFNLGVAQYRGDYFDSWSTVNNTDTLITSFSSLTSFDSNLPRVSSVQVYVSAISAIDSLSSWYSSHLYTNSLSAKFLRNFLTADFIGYPTYYFADFQTQVTLTSSNYTTSPGICFYGEGHTEKINLSAALNSNIQRYIWTVGDSDTVIYQVSTVDLSGARAAVNINTEIGYYPRIPVSLLVTNSDILTSSPVVYYPENLSGGPSFYPYYSTTLDVEGNESVVNTYLKQSIKVNSYESPLSSFSPGIEGEVELPEDNQAQSYTASLVVALSGKGAIGGCLDKYGLLWKWSTFSECSAFSTASQLPSSWANTQCLVSAGTVGPLSATSAPAGKYPKRWRNEGTLSATQFTPSPVYYTASSLNWTLSTPYWEVDTTLPSTITDYIYTLRYEDDGSTPFTASINNVTPIYISGSQTIFGIISAFPYDWQQKQLLLTDSGNATIVPEKRFKLYTANKYPLTGTQVKFQNLSVNLADVDRVVIDLGENIIPTLSPETIILSGADITKDIYTTYFVPGKKTVQATVFSNSGQSFVTTFTDIVDVVTRYDDVVVENYRTKNSALVLPWLQKPVIGPNEWVTENNINSVITKFIDNLSYLQNRGREYSSAVTDYIGWLGTPAITGTGCPVYTWEDLDCFKNNESVTWVDVQQLDTNQPEITADGKLVTCGTWEQQTCSSLLQNPNCLGKHCIEWKWKSRKCATAKEIITWKDTRCNQPFAKKWYFEPCETTTGEILIGNYCDEGYWNVNITHLNKYYDPINNCIPITKCIYRYIESRNNIIYIGLNTELKVLSSDYAATPIASRLTLDDVSSFRNIKGLGVDSQNKLYILDAGLSKVGSYIFNPDTASWEIFTVWGGVGTSNSQTKFFTPNDLHIDLIDNIWIADTGNKCIKQYSNSGSWLQTIKDDFFQENEPLSVVVDSDNHLHVLTKKEIRIYTYSGEYLTSYYFNNLTSEIPVRIKTNKNREVIYVVLNSQVYKFFRNGVYYGEIINNKPCVTDINDVVQDEFRNVLIAAGDKVVKYFDVMQVTDIKGPLPGTYWPTNSLLIHKNEYVQNWVYNKAFQRLWDNIEFFRHSLIFENTGCRKYVAPVYSKNDILIGQNEIVTSAVVNRVISYLWTNLSSVINYFDPSCPNG